MDTEKPFVRDLQSLDNKSLITGHEAAHYLGIAEQTLRIQRIRGGGAKFVKVGGAVKYRISDLEEYIQSRTFENTSQMGA